MNNVRNLLLTEKARKRQRRVSTPEPAAEVEIAAEADEGLEDDGVEEQQVDFDIGKTRKGGDALWLGGKFLRNVNE
jgi:hypothetical protein